MKKKVTLKQIWKQFKPVQMIHIATCEGKKPRVRPMSMIHYDKKLWVSTYTGDAKVKQLKRNPNFEFCLLFKKGKYSGYIRGFGRARIITGRRTRKQLAAAIPFFKNYWKTPDDWSFCLIQLKLKAIEYEAPGAMKVVRMKVK